MLNSKCQNLGHLVQIDVLLFAVNDSLLGTFSIRFLVGNGKPQTAKCHVAKALRSRLQFAVHV